jgi:hypothetical protein
MVPAGLGGFEPPTFRFGDDYSTVELQASVYNFPPLGAPAEGRTRNIHGLEGHSSVH